MKRATVTTALLATAMAATTACTPQPNTSQNSHGLEFALGMTADELYKASGPPTWHTADGKPLLTAREVRVARQLGQTIEDVYERKTASNTYRYTVSFGYDYRQSRFQPTARVRAVRLELDRPAGNLEALLAAFPGAASLCSKGCTLYRPSLGEPRPDGGSYLRERWVLPANPSPQELEDAALINMHWDASLVEERKVTNREMAKLEWHQTAGGKLVRGVKPKEYIKGLTIQDGNQIGDLQAIEIDHYIYQPVPAGTWQPAGSSQ